MAEPLHAREAAPGPHGRPLPGDDISLHDPNLAVLEAAQDHVPGATPVPGRGTERNGQNILDPKVAQDLRGGRGNHTLHGPKVVPGQDHRLIPDPRTEGGDLVAEAGPVIDGDGHVLLLAPGIGDVGGRFPVVGLAPEIEPVEGNVPVRDPVLVTGEGGLGPVPDPRTGGGAFGHDHIPGTDTASWWPRSWYQVAHVKLVFMS